MLGNPKWFKRRKYSGWGLTPATWQGWAYLGVLICSVCFVFLVTTWLEIQTFYQIGIVLFMLILITIDCLHIAFRMDKDERETAHEALAERNSAWVMGIVLAGGILFQSTISFLEGNLYVDPFIVTALVSGIIAKGISNWYYMDK